MVRGTMGDIEKQKERWEAWWKNNERQHRGLGHLYKMNLVALETMRKGARQQEVGPRGDMKPRKAAWKQGHESNKRGSNGGKTPGNGG